MARGPRPTPTTILKLRGSWRGKKNRGEPRPPAGAPDRPAWLDDEAAAVWDQLVPQLEALRVLSEIDGQTLARYCVFWIRWRKAEAFLRQYGETYPIKDDDGRIKCMMPWPQVAISAKLAAALLRIEQEFGLTPSARSRITVAPPEEAHPNKKRFFA